MNLNNLSMENVFRILAVALVVFYMFCIYVIKASANSVRRDKSTTIGAGDISSKECLEVLMNGNFYPQNDLHYPKLFY